MTGSVVSFPTVPWTQGAHPLERKKNSPDGSVTLLTFAVGFSDPVWCDRGHSGYVLQGRLTLEMEAGTLDVNVGEGFIIDAGSRHRASNRGEEDVVLFIVSTPAV